MYQGTNIQYDFFYVDLGEDFVVKLVLLQGRDLNKGARSKDLEFFVGDVTPPAPDTTRPIDRTKYVLCGMLNYQLQVNAFNGVTCNKWPVGRYVIVQNNQPASASIDGKLALREFLVFGFEWSTYKNNQ